MGSSGWNCLRGTHVSLYLSHLVFVEGAVKALIHQGENCERSRVEIFVHGGKVGGDLFFAENDHSLHVSI